MVTFTFSRSDFLYDGVDLKGIDVIEQDTLFIRKARRDVERQAQKMLHQGMETQVRHYGVTGVGKGGYGGFTLHP